MRRDLILTALVFAAVGFAAGYAHWRPAGVQLRSADLGLTGLEPAADALPPDHPPMNVAQQWQGLKQRAEQNPEDSKAARELADFLYDQARWDDAVFWYRRALALEPKNTDARTDLATCYFQLGRLQEAADEYKLALELAPNKPEALYGLAMTRWHEKDAAGARRAYDQLRRNHPDFPGVEPLAQLLKGPLPR